MSASEQKHIDERSDMLGKTMKYYSDTFTKFLEAYDDFKEIRNLYNNMSPEEQSTNIETLTRFQEALNASELELQKDVQIAYERYQIVYNEYQQSYSVYMTLSPEEQEKQAPNIQNLYTELIELENRLKVADENNKKAHRKQIALAPRKTTVRAKQKPKEPDLYVQDVSYQHLLQSRDLWNGSDKEISELLELVYPDETPIINDNRSDVLTEIISMLINTYVLNSQRDIYIIVGSSEYQEFSKKVNVEKLPIIRGFDFIMDFLARANEPNDVLWNQPCFNLARDNIRREIFILQAKEPGVKGMGKCRYCPSEELRYASKQVRSGDEGMTVFVMCVQCKKQWTIN